MRTSHNQNTSLGSADDSYRSCPHCGHLNPIENQCCDRCDKLLDEVICQDSHSVQNHRNKNLLAAIAVVLLLAVIIVVIFVGSTPKACVHEWSPADCTTPQTCSLCGESEGEAAGHIWREATYTAPKLCSICGLTEGEPLIDPAIAIIREHLPIVTYAMGNTSKLYGYYDSALTQKNQTDYFDSISTEIVITDISEDGSALEVRFPSAVNNSYQDLWFPREDIISLLVARSGTVNVANRITTYRYTHNNDQILYYGYMLEGDVYIILGLHPSAYTMVLYNIFEKSYYDIDVQYKIGLIE